MGVKEYKYLVDAFKTEIMLLRGDLQKSSIPIHVVTDKKLLAFIPNNAIGAGSDGTAGEVLATDATLETNADTTAGCANEETESKPSQMMPSSGEGFVKNDLATRKRGSLLNLEPTDIILKYCDLKAQYDNLKESASEKIYELTNQSKIDAETPKSNPEEDKALTDKFTLMITEKENALVELNEKMVDENNARKKIEENLIEQIEELKVENKKVKEDRNAFQADFQSSQVMIEVNITDIVYLTEKVEKHSKLIF